MPTEQAERTIELIIAAYKESGMDQVAFGALLEIISEDFKQGKVHEPELVN